MKELWDTMSAELRKFQVPPSSCWWEDDAFYLREETAKYGHTELRGLQGLTCDLGDWTPLLTPHEQRNLEGYRKKFVERFGAEGIPQDMAVTVMQSPEAHPSHTRIPDSALPTYLASGTPKIFHLAKKRWQTTREKFQQMGFPATSRTAEACKVLDEAVN